MRHQLFIIIIQKIIRLTLEALVFNPLFFMMRAR